MKLGLKNLVYCYASFDNIFVLIAWTFDTLKITQVSIMNSQNIIRRVVDCISINISLSNIPPPPPPKKKKLGSFGNSRHEWVNKVSILWERNAYVYILVRASGQYWFTLIHLIIQLFKR